MVITELPPGVWTEDYRDKLLSWTETASKENKEKATNRPGIQAVYDYSDNDRVEIHV